MTPDDVVARARELVGKEVLLTIRGKVYDNAMRMTVKADGNNYARCIEDDFGAVSDLVSIEPAPLRIEPGAYYRTGAGELLRGDDTGGLQGFDGYIEPGDIRADSDLVRVRVVEA